MKMSKAFAVCACLVTLGLPVGLFLTLQNDAPVPNPISGAFASLPSEPPSIAGVAPQVQPPEKRHKFTSGSKSRVGFRREDASHAFEVPDKRQLEPKHVALLLKNAGFPTEVIPKLVCTAKYESMYDTQAKNVNRDGSQDTGLFQINDLWLKECSVSRKQLLDPEVNVACARKVFREHGYWAWYGYRQKQDKCKAFRLKPSTMVALSAH